MHILLQTWGKCHDRYEQLFSTKAYYRLTMHLLNKPDKFDKIVFGCRRWNKVAYIRNASSHLEKHETHVPARRFSEWVVMVWNLNQNRSHMRRKGFSRGSKKDFLGGAKSGEISFHPLATNYLFC